MSAEGKARIAEAQRVRWARQKGDSGSVAASSSGARKSAGKKATRKSDPAKKAAKKVAAPAPAA